MPLNKFAYASRFVLASSPLQRRETFVFSCTCLVYEKSSWNRQVKLCYLTRFSSRDIFLNCFNTLGFARAHVSWHVFIQPIENYNLCLQYFNSVTISTTEVSLDSAYLR